MMHSIRRCDWDNITEHSLLRHFRDVSDYCKCYALHLKTKNGKTEEIARRVQSQCSGWINTANQKGKGFIYIKPFLHTKKEAIYGSNAKHLEWRLSILQDKKYKYIFYFILLINYNSTLDKFIFWPVQVLLKLLLKTRIKKLLDHFVPL